MYALVKDLPEPVQNALASVGYGRADIEVITSATVHLPGSLGDGYQGYITLVNLDNGQYETHRGSWGGSNMFVRTHVDDDKGAYPLPARGVAITGQRGGGKPVSGTLHIPASMTAHILPSAPVELSPVEREALGIYKGIKSSYRPEYLRRAKVTQDVLDGLVERGLLKRNSAGATQITTEGKNALGSNR